MLTRTGQDRAIRARAFTAVATAAAIMTFAGNSLLTRAALGNDLIAPGAFSAIRLAAGAIILLPWFLRGGSKRVDMRQALALFIYAVAFSFAYRALDAGAGAMILFAAVQAVIVISAWSASEHLRGTEMTGMALALLGMIILLGMPDGTVPLIPALTMAGAGCAWGVYTIMGRGTDNAARSTAGNFLIAAIVAAPLLMIRGGTATTTKGMTLAVVAGALTSGLGYVVWYSVVPKLRHATIGAAQLATPVIAAIGGALLLGETLTWRMALAAGLILGGIALTVGATSGKETRPSGGRSR